uniref:Corticotropin-releasing factor-binding protein n=1 Tax=Gadus morhua TaxID=8049 RepID=A0A8C5AAB7_GADMO
MAVSARIHMLLLLISLLSRLGLGRYIEVRNPSFPMLACRCLDMLATEGQFTFMTAQPQLACAAFLIGEPTEVISLELSDVNIDCSAGDFIKIFDGWVLKGEKFPSSQDHPLPLRQRYTDYCSSSAAGGAVLSSQNVAMVFFRIHSPDSGFTLTVKKQHNPMPCNIMSQSPEGSFTMVMPHHHWNCSFSIIYPVELQLTELSLGQHCIVLYCTILS